MAHIQDRGREVERRWQARYRDPIGRERSRTFRRKLDAQRWLDEVTADVVTGRYVAPEDARQTFRQYAELWRAAQVHRPSTAAKVESVLRNHAYPMFGDAPLAAVTPTEVQGWVKRLSATMAPSTVSVTYGIVAGVFRAAVRDRKLGTSPCEGIRLPEDHRDPVLPLTVDQVAALREGLPDRYRALVTVAASTGLRQGELLGLTIDRSGLRPPSRTPTLTVDRQLVQLPGRAVYLGPPKRRASRRAVPLPQVTVEALAGHLASFPSEPVELDTLDASGRPGRETVELVFTTGGGQPVRRSKFGDVWRNAVRRAREQVELPMQPTLHDLRHFYASLLIRHGESVKVVQARLGHATAAETLDTYSHLWPDSEDRTRAAVDTVLLASAEPSRNGVEVQQ